MNNREPTRSLLDRFPALSGLRGGAGARRLPVIQSATLTDCGAACLAMVLGYYGKSVKLEDIRRASGTDRDGTDALALLQAGRLFGLRGRGLRVEPEDLSYLGPGAILHWEFNHFVVLERVRRGAIDILDPAYGRRRVGLPDFRKSFTGVALTFEPAEDFAPQTGAPVGVWRYFRRVLSQPGVVVQLLVTSLLIQLFLLATPVLTSALVDRIVPRGDHQLLTVLAAGFLAIVVFNYLALVVRAHLLLHLRTNLDVQLMLGFLEHLVSLPYEFFQRRSAGDLMMRLSSNATMREMLTSSMMSALLDGLMVVLYLVLLFLINVPMALVVVGLGLLKIVVYFASRETYRILMAQDLAAQARSEGYLVEVLSGIETLKAIGAERRAVEHWSNLFVDQLNVALRRGRVSALVDASIAALALASPLAILLFGVTQVLAGQLSLGTMLGLTALGTGFLTPLSALVSTALSLQLLKSYVERIEDVLEQAPEQPTDAPRAAPELRGGITLEQVTFSYGPLAPPAVNDVSLEIRPGQNVAIVGRSGAGKSTLARLLLALYSPARGRILFDGIDLATLDVRSVRKQMGIVPQEPFLFSGSIRENILLADPTQPLEAAVAAAKLANIHDEIVGLPMGYNTLISEGGTALSAGQRQRVALARAVVHKPAILLLDEATSALDTINERAIQENLRRLSCTRVVIAHRLSTVIGADLILVLDQGRLAERGTHAELLAAGGVYATLVAAQLQADK